MDIINKIYPKRKENPRLICGKICWLIERCTHNLKYFILRNRHFIDILFIFVYLLEQIVFIYFVYIKKYNLEIVWALFLLLLLSTLAIERVFMNLRYKTFEEEVYKLTSYISELDYGLESQDMFIKEYIKNKRSK